MITVEDAIAARHVSSGFMLQNRVLLGNGDPITFPHGKDDVIQLAVLLGAAPLYTWTKQVKRIVDESCGDYPLHEAIRSLHYFHQPSMFWLFDDPVMWIQPPQNAKKEAPAPIDAILIAPFFEGKRTMRDFAQDLLLQVSGTPEDRARIAEAFRERVAGVVVTAFTSMRTGIPTPLPIGWAAAGSRLCVPTMITQFVFGRSAVVSMDEIVEEQHTDPTICQEQTRLRQWVLAAAALLKQRILVTEIQLATRGERKRLERAELPTSVMTIQLRATERTGSSETTTNVIEWSHRWIVRGHWRQQWYPSQREHRVLWIPPYIKGPDDQPLVVRPAVYAVTR